MEHRSVDWLFTASLLLLIGALVVIAKTQAIRTGELIPKAPMIVDVIIEGHVSKPGVYSAELGTPFSQVIKRARPKTFARECQGRVREACTVHVEKLAELVVSVTGAVAEPVEKLVIPAGTRISDLKRYVTMQPNADKRFLSKRRMLKNGEEIKIPLDKKNL